MADDLTRMRRDLQELSARVEVLEARQGVTPAAAPTATPMPEAPAVPVGMAALGAFWALEGLQSRLGDAPETGGGAVMLVGSLTLPGGAPVAWQQGAETEGLLETDWGDRAAVFGALAHPVRIELLRHMLNGIQATADLAAIDGLGTTGQLHHHLRQLVAAGWVHQSGRGSYEIPAARIVPLLACVVGASR